MSAKILCKRSSALTIIVSLVLLIVCCSPVGPTGRATTDFSWTPHWSSDKGAAEQFQSRIDLVQGLPGYSLIAGKDTLVAFTPYPSGMRTDEESSWLDVYEIHAWGADAFPEVSHIRGTPVGSSQECDYWGNRCAEMNFLVEGKYLEAPGDYWFVVTWHAKNYGPITDSIVARFQWPVGSLSSMPAAPKILFVPVNDDIFNSPDLNAHAMRSIKHYLSRMPFASNAVEEVGLSSRYWDIYPNGVAIDQQKIDDAACRPYDLCHLLAPIGAALSDYNSYASIKAFGAVGLLFFGPGAGCGGAGCGSSMVALCDAGSEGQCTHEIGHIIGRSDEDCDSYASTYTCGYFGNEVDDSFYCHDWAYDISSQAIYDVANPPLNVMSWAGADFQGFYTRHFYETACIYYGGGCESVSSSGVFRLRALDSNQYLLGDRNTGEVSLSDSDDPQYSWWTTETVRQEGDRTYITLDRTLFSNTGYFPFSMLIGNPSTGEVKTTDPDYYFHYRDQFRDWCHEWRTDQIATGIVTLHCFAWPDGNGFLKWEDSESLPSFAEPDTYDEEHWTPSLQWRVIGETPMPRH